MNLPTQEEILHNYPIKGLVPGWSFKKTKEASGRYRVEGADQEERYISLPGYDPDILLDDCVQLASRCTILRDELTRLPNRKLFYHDLTKILNNEHKKDFPLSVISMDIDNFQTVNCYMGHIEGDKILCRIADLLQEISKQQGVSVYRYGGDEYSVILTGTNNAESLHFLQKAQQGLRDLKIKYDSSEYDNQRKLITMTGGIATTTDFALSAEQLLLIADKDLYEKKGYKYRMNVVSIK